MRQHHQKSVTAVMPKGIAMYDEMIEDSKARIAFRKQKLEAMQQHLTELKQAFEKASKEYHDHGYLCKEMQSLIEREIESIHKMKEKRHRASAGKVEWLSETCCILI